jgi:hypothetical protein
MEVLKVTQTEWIGEATSYIQGGLHKIAYVVVERPVAIVHAGMSFVTNEPAPTIAPSPIVTPGIISDSIPIWQRLHKCTGATLYGSISLSPPT